MKYSHAPRNSVSRFVPIVLVIIITIVAVAAVITIGRALMGGGNESNNRKQTTSETESDLLSTSLGRGVRLTVRGPIVANEKFRTYQVTVKPDSRSLITYEGYLEKQLGAKNLDNNIKAYEEFVYALDKRKMMDSRKLKDEQNDLRGICAKGKVYVFETLKNGQTVSSVWTSDCGGSKGSAVANVNEVTDLFLKQIPGGRKTVGEIGLVQQENLFKL